MIRREELIKIGQINKPHALVGEMSFTFTDDIFDRTDCPYVVCNIDGIFVPFFIEEYRFKSSSTALIKFEGVDSADRAKMFTNLDVYFPKEYIEDDEAIQGEGGKDFFLNYQVDVVGHGIIGSIVAVDDSTANVLFEIEAEDEDEPILIPAVEEFVESIDPDNKIIRMVLPEGLLDF